MSEFRFAQKAIILNKKRTHILVQKYLTSKYLPAKLVNKFALPGGKMEFGELPDDSFIREVEQETGIIITPLEPIDIWTWIYDKDGVKTQIVAVSRLAEYKKGKLIDPSKANKEKETTISKAEWIKISEIPIERFVIDEQPSIRKFLKNLKGLK